MNQNKKDIALMVTAVTIGSLLLQKGVKELSRNLYYFYKKKTTGFWTSYGKWIISDAGETNPILFMFAERLLHANKKLLHPEWTIQITEVNRTSNKYYFSVVLWNKDHGYFMGVTASSDFKKYDVTHVSEKILNPDTMKFDTIETSDFALELIENMQCDKY